MAADTSNLLVILKSEGTRSLIIEADIKVSAHFSGCFSRSGFRV